MSPRGFSLLTSSSSGMRTSSATTTAPEKTNTKISVFYTPQAIGNLVFKASSKIPAVSLSETLSVTIEPSPSIFFASDFNASECYVNEPFVAELAIQNISAKELTITAVSSDGNIIPSTIREIPEKPGIIAVEFTPKKSGQLELKVGIKGQGPTNKPLVIDVKKQPHARWDLATNKQALFGREDKPFFLDLETTNVKLSDLCITAVDDSGENLEVTIDDSGVKAMRIGVIPKKAGQIKISAVLRGKPIGDPLDVTILKSPYVNLADDAVRSEIIENETTSFKLDTNITSEHLDELNLQIMTDRDESIPWKFHDGSVEFAPKYAGLIMIVCGVKGKAEQFTRVVTVIPKPSATIITLRERSTCPGNTIAIQVDTVSVARDELFIHVKENDKADDEEDSYVIEVKSSKVQFFAMQSFMEDPKEGEPTANPKEHVKAAASTTRTGSLTPGDPLHRKRTKSSTHRLKSAKTSAVSSTTTTTTEISSAPASPSPVQGDDTVSIAAPESASAPTSPATEHTESSSTRLLMAKSRVYRKSTGAMEAVKVEVSEMKPTASTVEEPKPARTSSRKDRKKGKEKKSEAPKLEDRKASTTASRFFDGTSVTPDEHRLLYNISFTPKKERTYILTVEFQKKNSQNPRESAKNSPVTIVSMNRQTARITGVLSGDRSFVKRPVSVGVDLVHVAPADIVVTINYGSGPKSQKKVETTSKGGHAIKFIPMVDGPVIVEAKMKGTGEHITGSPFTIPNVEPIPWAKVDVKGKGKHAEMGQQFFFRIISSGNVLREDLKIEVIDEKKKTPIQCIVNLGTPESPQDEDSSEEPEKKTKYWDCYFFSDSMTTVFARVSLFGEKVPGTPFRLQITEESEVFVKNRKFRTLSKGRIPISRDFGVQAPFPIKGLKKSQGLATEEITHMASKR